MNARCNIVGALILTASIAAFAGSEQHVTDNSLLRLPQPDYKNLQLEYIPPHFSDNKAKMAAPFERRTITLRDFNAPFVLSEAPHTRLGKFTSNYNTAGAIKLWNNGYLVGSGSMETHYALGNFASANLGYMHDFGNVAITAGVVGEKFHINRGVYNRFGVYGHTSFQLTDKLSLNIHGSYFQTPAFHSPAALGYSGSTSYGGTLSYDINDKWNIEAGVNRYYDTYTRSWRTVPVFIPSFRLGKAKLGFDIGGLLYGILNEILINDDDFRPNGASPTHSSPARSTKLQRKYGR